MPENQSFQLYMLFVLRGMLFFPFKDGSESYLIKYDSFRYNLLAERDGIDPQGSRIYSHYLSCVQT